jgi:gluconate kinase
MAPKTRRKSREEGLQAPRCTRIAVVRGVPVAGKTTVGAALARRFESRLATLEPPAPDGHAPTVSVDAPSQTVVARIAAALIQFNSGSGTIA